MIANQSKDNWETHWSNYSLGAEENPAQNYRRKIVLKELSNERIARFSLIDFGSGQGDLIRDLSKLFPQAKLVGFELSTKGVSISKEKVPQAEFIRVDVLEKQKHFGKYDNYADYGVCAEVIEHLDKPIEFLNNIKRYLKHNAKLILTVPGGKMSAYDKHIGHRKHYSIRDLRQVFNSAGYKNIKIRARGFPFFNVYKIISILRGAKLIRDYEEISSRSSLSMTEKILAKIASFFFLLNIDLIPWGWQLVAIAEAE
jgi:SAM-dependent methyltransferase